MPLTLREGESFDSDSPSLTDSSPLLTSSAECLSTRLTESTSESFWLLTLSSIGLEVDCLSSLGQTNYSILCFSDSAGHIIAELKKKNVKNVIKGLRD